MRVYEINVTGVFSTGTIVKNIQKKLLSEGDGCRFAFGHGGIPDENSFSLSGIWRQRFDIRAQRITGREGAFYIGKTKRLIKDIKEFNPDIIHLHNLHGNFLHLKTLLRFLAKYDRKVVLTLHDCWAFTGGCTHFTVNGCYKWKEECNDCAYKNRYLLSRICPVEKKEFYEKKKLFGDVKDLTVTTVSEWLKKTAEQSFLGNRKIVTVYNGIDNEIFTPKDASGKRRSLGLEGKKVILGVASSWSERKGLSKWKELSENIGDDYRIILVGLNAKQAESFNDKVIALPRVKDVGELVDLYNIADVYVSLSLEETFGLPTSEAMACGTPAVVLDSTATAEPVDDKTGIVLKEYSLKELISAIETLAVNKEQYSQNCVKRVEKLFSSNVMAENYYAVFKRVLESK